MIQEEIKRRFNSGNAFYHSVQNQLSSRLLSKNVNCSMGKALHQYLSIARQRGPTIDVEKHLIDIEVFVSKM
jgi:hypothetical protein